MRKPSLWIGAWVGLLLTAALIALFYLANQLLGLPFVPFDLFDWLSRILPGAVITFSIDIIVNLISTLNLGQTSSAAKAAEQTLAVLGPLVVGIVVGGLLFAFLRRRERRNFIPGLLLGGVLGVLALLISAGVNQTAATGPVLSGAWILLLFLAWGAALNAVYNRLDVRGAGSRAMAEGLSRRQFLVRLAGATAVITVVGTGLGAFVGSRRKGAVALAPGERWSNANPLPNAGAAVEPAPGTRPELTPLEQHYRIDINTTPPTIDEASWQLQVSGLVNEPKTFSLANLRDDYTPMSQFVTLACISNRLGGDLTSTTRWTGVSMQKLLPDFGLQDGATHLKITSVDGFYEYVDLQTIQNDERVMLSYAWDGVPLTTGHGFPLRIYIPDRYGMKQPKWITSIEAVDAWEAGYWVTRGWDKDALMQATSVIDTVATDMMIAEADNTTLVPVGGIAHAGARGISKVEVKVDDGDWQAAQLREPLSSTTWVLWRFDWPFQAGEHTFAVRCYDGDGTLQITEMTPPHPSGATGLFSESAML